MSRLRNCGLYPRQEVYLDGRRNWFRRWHALPFLRYRTGRGTPSLWTLRRHYTGSLTPPLSCPLRHVRGGTPIKPSVLQLYPAVAGGFLREHVSFRSTPEGFDVHSEVWCSDQLAMGFSTFDTDSFRKIWISCVGGLSVLSG